MAYAGTTVSSVRITFFQLLGLYGVHASRVNLKASRLAVFPNLYVASSTEVSPISLTWTSHSITVCREDVLLMRYVNFFR